MFERIRYKYAFKFGRFEHFFGRFMFLILFFGIIFAYYELHFVVYLTLILAMLDWIGYYLCHRIEKAFFPGNKRRRK